MIGFNPKFLIDILKVLDQEEVSMFFTNPKAPCLLKMKREAIFTLFFQ